MVVAIIFLFVGVAFAPSITAQVNQPSKTSADNSGTVEITTETCGIKEVKPHTVKLTKQQAEEIDHLFETIKNRLDNATTQQETIAIFNDAVISLDKYDLLPRGLSVEQAQKLVISEYQNKRIFEILKRTHNKYGGALDDKENFMCLTTGISTGTYFDSFLTRAILRILIILEPLIEHIWNPIAFGILLYTWWVIFDGLDMIRPIIFGSTMSFLYNSQGWIFTLGINGIKTWRGHLEGKINDSLYDGGAAAEGFTGIKLTIIKADNSNICYYLGTSLYVAIDATPT